MSYFAQSSDLVARYGADNLARMADPDGTGVSAALPFHHRSTVDMDRIGAAGPRRTMSYPTNGHLRRISTIDGLDSSNPRRISSGRMRTSWLFN